MRQAYAHEAMLSLPPEADERAPGAVVTAVLCGHWEHEPPCPLAPHHVRADRADGEVRVRILFAAEPAADARSVAASSWPCPGSGRCPVT